VRGGSTPELIEAATARGDIGRARADLYLAWALGTDWRRVPARLRSAVPWDGTLPLLRLRQRVARMSPGPARSSIGDALTEEAAGSAGSCGSEAGGASAFSSTHFYIEYGPIGGGLSIADYVASLDGSWSKQVGTFGWAAPPVAPSPAPGSRYHVVVANLGPGLYGFVSTSGTHAGLVGNNPSTTWNDVDAYATCMALNRDYSAFPSPPQESLDATTAHEFNHSLQFGYGAITGANSPDDAFVEGGATWAEDEVYDAADDNHFYLWPDFDDDMGDYDASPYPYWITFRGLTERYGTGVAGAGEQVMQDFWELTSKSSTSNMLTALDQAVVNKGVSNLSAAYHAYAIAVKFNRGCGGGYQYPYCFDEGPDYTTTAGATIVHRTISSVGGSVTGSLPDNYSLSWVRLPSSGGPYDVTLENRSSVGGQLRGTLACDTGSSVERSEMPSVAGPGATVSLATYSPPSGCASPVLVITNQAQTSGNPTMSSSRGYRVLTSSSTPDTMPPDTTITSGPSGVVASVTASFTYSATEAPATFECSLDAEPWVSCPAAGVTYTGLAEGPHTFSVRAIDAAMNADPTPAERTWTVDIGDDVLHARSVSLRLVKHLVARGRVGVPDGYGPCASGEQVLIQRKRGSWVTVKKAVTGSAGAFRAALMDRPGRYRALVRKVTEKPGHQCGPARSVVRRHSH
jgi:hypothetical protein